MSSEKDACRRHAYLVKAIFTFFMLQTQNMRNEELLCISCLCYYYSYLPSIFSYTFLPHVSIIQYMKCISADIEKNIFISFLYVSTCRYTVHIWGDAKGLRVCIKVQYSIFTEMWLLKDLGKERWQVNLV